MGVAFAPMTLDQYRRRSMDLLKIPSIIEQVQIVAFLRENNDARSGLSDVHGGMDEMSDVVVVDPDENDTDLYGVMSSTKAERMVLDGSYKSCELIVGQCTRRYLDDLIWMANHSTTLEEQLRKTVWELQEVQNKLQAARSSVLET